jgi:hypothetical protein
VKGHSLDDSLKNFGDNDSYFDQYGRELNQDKVNQYGYTTGSAGRPPSDDSFFEDNFYADSDFSDDLDRGNFAGVVDWYPSDATEPF